MMEHSIPSPTKTTTLNSSPTSRLSCLYMGSNRDAHIPETPPTPPVMEWNLADIEILKELGKGISGIVLLAKHKHKNDQFFALKVIQMKFNELERKAINAELKINQSVSVNCSYVVNCYEHFKYNKEVSILLEHMDCGTLEHLLEKKKRIPERYLAAICNQLLKGLSYLHYELVPRIIHRDLKPSNFLINRRGETKISDFGVSAILKRTYSMAGTYTGTKFYMAPERIEGDEHNIRSDIWSLGLAVLEFATGQFPYPLPENSADFLFLESIAEGPPPRASSLEFSEEFCSFIAKCLQKDPKERPSAHELLDHAFINKYRNMQIDLSSYFKMALCPHATT